MIVERFTSIGEAEVAAAALYAAGIDVALADDEIVAINWMWSNAVGGVKVVVWWEDLEIAGALLGILSEAEVFPDGGEGAEPAIETAAEETLTIERAPEVAESEPSPEESQEQVIRCPACGSTDARRMHGLALFFLFAFLFGGIGVAVGQTELAIAAVIAAVLIVATIPSHRCSECGERWNAKPLSVSDETGLATAWPPDIEDTFGEHCPRCGSEEFHHLEHRRLKAFMLLLPVTMYFVLPFWPFLAKRHCDACDRNA
jgi:Zn finger protein HypA/HybF involved in hydrogenase expression